MQLLIDNCEEPSEKWPLGLTRFSSHSENDLVKIVGNMDFLQRTFILNFTANVKTNPKTKVICYDKANHCDNYCVIGQTELKAKAKTKQGWENIRPVTNTHKTTSYKRGRTGNRQKGRETCDQ